MKVPLRGGQRRLTCQLLVLAVGMFGFAFALVPLYRVFCELTGVNGRLASTAANIEQMAARNATQEVPRQVTLQLLAQVSNGLAWEFRPLRSQMQVRLGESHTARFYVRNRSHHAVTGQAVPSVAPGLAARYLHKTECFCFTNQLLQAGESMEMPVTFIVDSDLPTDIGTLSLSYTLYLVPQDSSS